MFSQVAMMHTTTTPSSAPETAPQPEQQLLHKEELLQPTRKKSKDLAKFLGVDHPSQQRHRSCDLGKKQKRNSALLDLQINGLIDFDEDYHPASPAHGDNVVMRRNKKKGSVNSSGSSRSSRPRSLLVNWGNMMKR